MKKFSLILLILCAALLLAACGQSETSPSGEPSAEPATAVPSAEPSGEPTEEPAVEPSAEPSHGFPDTPGLEAMICEKWTEDRPTEYPLDSAMTRLDYELVVAHSDTTAVDADPPIGETDWLLRVTGGDELYEVVGFSRRYDEDGFRVFAPTWRSGANGAGVDIETGVALVAALVARPELLPSSGDRYLDDEENEPSVLCKIGEDKVLIYATAHTDRGLGQDYGVFAAVPIALAGKDYTGNPYEVIAVNYGNGWQTLEG